MSRIAERLAAYAFRKHAASGSDDTFDDDDLSGSSDAKQRRQDLLQKLKLGLLGTGALIGGAFALRGLAGSTGTEAGKWLAKAIDGEKSVAAADLAKSPAAAALGGALVAGASRSSVVGKTPLSDIKPEGDPRAPEILSNSAQSRFGRLYRYFRSLPNLGILPASTPDRFYSEIAAIARAGDNASGQGEKSTSLLSLKTPSLHTPPSPDAREALRQAERDFAENSPTVPRKARISGDSLRMLEEMHRDVKPTDIANRLLELQHSPRTTPLNAAMTGLFVQVPGSSSPVHISNVQLSVNDLLDPNTRFIVNTVDNGAYKQVNASALGAVDPAQWANAQFDNVRHLPSNAKEGLRLTPSDKLMHIVQRQIHTPLLLNYERALLDAATDPSRPPDVRDRAGQLLRLVQADRLVTHNAHMYLAAGTTPRMSTQGNADVMQAIEDKQPSVAKAYRNMMLAAHLRRYPRGVGPVVNRAIAGGALAGGGVLLGQWLNSGARRLTD